MVLKKLAVLKIVTTPWLVALLICTVLNEADADAVNEAALETTLSEDDVKDDKMMEKIKENMTLDLTESTGKDWSDLSTVILNTAWANNGNKTEISVLELMKWFENVGGEDRLHLLRILELMDQDMDGLIAKEEFVSLYADALASPVKALELLHRVIDYDGNGVVSVWETLTQVLTVGGINRNIYDKYQEAANINRMMDTNRDFFISLHEFTNYMVWQMNKGIGTQQGILSWLFD